MFPASVQVSDKEKSIDCNLIMDIGLGTPVLLFPGEHTGIRLPDGAKEQVLGYGVQGAIRGHKGTAHSVRIAGYELSDVFAGFQDPDDRIDRGQAGIIGMPLFQRFKIIFDYRGGRLILEPGRRFTEPFGDPFADVD
jgi:hypothetical protein